MTSPNPSYKPSEGKREEFRKYLEKNGVMDALTRVLVHLYEEVDKPEDALEYIRDRLSIISGLETNKQLQLRLSDAETRIRELEAQLHGGVDQGEEQPDATMSAGGSQSELPVGEQLEDAVQDEQVINIEPVVVEVPSQDVKGADSGQSQETPQ
ncbi:hypothetical protein ABEB36_004795 [Hypothenemus hampei]|uniref:c-Myc-binding protein n=1 Tax=Hypothenemus hampei TaxID=57062 RepID=A0ABD1EW03_HYPHA